jgi:hypothetical protein
MKKKLGLLLAVVMMMAFVSGCTQGNTEPAKDVDIDEIHQAVKDEFGEDYIPSMELSKEDVEALMGVNGENIDSLIAEMPMISVNVDTFIAIKAQAGKGEAVEADLEAYRLSLIEQGMNYPMNQPKINSAKVVRYGDYAFFIMLGKYDDRENITEEEALDFAKEEVRRAEEVIAAFFK